MLVDYMCCFYLECQWVQLRQHSRLPITEYIFVKVEVMLKLVFLQLCAIEK